MHDRRHPLLVLWATVAVSAFAAALLPVTAAPAAAPRPLFEQIGTLERFGADARAAFGSQVVPTWENASTFQRQRQGGMIVLPAVRQLWQLYIGASGAETMVAVRDLDTLKIVRTLKLDYGLLRAPTAATEGGDWTHAVDDTGTRLFLLRSSKLFVHEIDLRTFASKAWPTPWSGIGLEPPIHNAGMTYDPFEDDLLLLSGGPGASATNVNTFVYRLDVTGTPPAAAPPTEPQKVYRLRSCTGPVTATDSVGDDTLNWDVLVTKDHLYVPCQRAGHTVIVVRMKRPEGNDPDHVEDVAAGPVYGENVQADPGSGRLFVATFTGQEIWAFEAATMSFVGAVATGPQGTQLPTGYGLDRATGRVYFQSPSFGLGVVEGRFFPVPQARTDAARKATGQERIWADAATNRVFVLEGDAINQNKAAAYRIYRTEPAPVPPSAPDPDRNTADVDERDGVTEVRYNASGSGYGSRVLLAKGYATVVPAPTAGVVAPTFPVFDRFKERCGYTDRDLFLGRVARAEYDTGSTAAAAAAVDADSATKQDLNQLTSRCFKELGTAGDAKRWAYEPAVCATSEGDEAKTDEGGGDGVLPNPGTSSVHCPEPGRTLEARAESTLTGATVEVDRSWTTTRIERTGEGVRSTVESVAQGVTLGDVLSIGEIRSRATSTSNGRPKRGDMSTHDIEIRNVVFQGQPVPTCQPTCDPVLLERDLNALAGARAVFRTGHGDNSGRDEALVDGSPRGAQTAVQKSVARQSSDRALVGDFTTEVPALEMTVFNDNVEWGRARQVYQFAGVATSATYNIVLRPSFGALPEDPGLPEDPVVADGGSTPFGDLLEQVGTGGTGPLPVAEAALRTDDDDGPGGLAGVVKAVARGLRLFLTSPRTALLLLTAWALLGSPAVLSRRRRLLAGVRGG